MASMTQPSAMLEAVDPYQDTESIKKLFQKRWEAGVYRRKWREAVWFRDLKFIEGSQWLAIDRTARLIDRPLPVPDFPRSITNKMVKIHDDLVNAVSQGKFPFINKPATDDAEDHATAEVQDRFDDLLVEESEINKIRRLADAWLCGTGNVFLLPHYDYDPKWGMKSFDYLGCPMCKKEVPVGDPSLVFDKKCPDCMERVPLEAGEDAARAVIGAMPDMEPFTKQLPKGRLRTKIYSPFEILFDNTIPYGEDRDWFISRSKVSVEKAQEMFQDFASLIKEGMPDALTQSNVDYYEALAWMGSVFGVGTGPSEGRPALVTISRLHQMPNSKYPLGLIATRIGADLIVESKPMFDETDEDKSWPLIHIVDRINPGAAWGKSRMTDIAPIQIRRNIVESLGQLTFQRTGAAKLLVPNGADIQNVVGEPGQMLKYQPVSHATGQPSEPHYLEAALGNIAFIERWLMQMDSAMEMIAGTYFLAGGDAPSGIEAASALALLDERAVRGVASLKENEIEGWRQWKILATVIMRKHMTDDRLLMVLGRNKQWQAEKFKQSDIKGSVDVIVDKEALFPKSEATKRATAQLLVQMQVLNPTDRETQFALAERFGETSLLGATDEALGQAIREYDRFMSDEMYIPAVKPLMQNNAVHYFQHRKDAMSQEYEQLMAENPERASIWEAHIMNTSAAMMAEMVSTGGMFSGMAMDSKGGMAGSLPGSSGAGTSGGESAPVKKGREEVAANRDELVPEEAKPAGQAT